MAKRTPLYDVHVQSGARMVEFAGWDMPVQYTGVIDEHLAVRTRAGLFDVSHMGQIEIAGNNALDAVQRISCNDASKLQVGQAQYSALPLPTGCPVDDVIVYRRAEERFLVVVNAANDVSEMPADLVALDHDRRREAAQQGRIRTSKHSANQHWSLDGVLGSLVKHHAIGATHGFGNVATHCRVLLENV